MKTKIFVYGTLKKGFSNNYLLIGQKLIGNFVTEKKYRLVSLGSFPGLIDGDKSIKGEVYEVSDECLSNLDILECVPKLYYRAFLDICDISDVQGYIYNLKNRYKVKDIAGDEWKA